MMNDMSYEQWLEMVPVEFSHDVLWRIKVYRLSLYLSDISWSDVELLNKKNVTRSVADQLYRSIGSIGANVAEGFSRNSVKDRIRFYEYALGSAREGRGWYYNARHILSEDIVRQRINILTDIIRLLLTMIPQQRNLVRDNQELYDTIHESIEDDK